MKKCGFVSVLGETNSGKSTLINSLVGQKVSIVSRKVQTTIIKILGITIHNESQIIFIDTPGFVSKKSESSLERIIWDAFRDSEHVLFVIDVNKKDFSKSEAILEKIHKNKKVSLVLNKIDLIYKPKLLEIANKLSNIRKFDNIFMISALNNDGTFQIKDYLSKVMPNNDWFFPENKVTDLNLEKFVSEITREHIFHRIHKEIPYKCIVETIFYKELENDVIIKQNIYINNDAHRIILLGHKGTKIRAIGKASRKELSELLKKKVHLFLKVVLKK